MIADAQYIPRFDLQGHRGSRGLLPENSIPAFLLALDSGVTTLEMDVVITKDNQVIVSHDPFMQSGICLDGAGNSFTSKEEKGFAIYRMTASEAQQFDCGSKGNPGFPEQKPLKVSKPLLKEVIAAVESHIRSITRYEVDYNIEIKSTPEGDGTLHPPVPEFCELVIATLNEYLPTDRIVIQSFDFRVLKYLHEKHPQIRLAALVANSKSSTQNLEDLGFNPHIYSPNFKLVNASLIEIMHARKIRVIPWTVNDVKDMLNLKSMGVDGLITDYPDRARKYKMTLDLPISK